MLSIVLLVILVLLLIGALPGWTDRLRQIH
jgi:hypothetical protein